MERVINRNEEANVLFAVLTVLSACKESIRAVGEIIEINGLMNENPKDLEEAKYYLSLAGHRINKVIGPYRWEVSMHARRGKT